MSGVYVFAINNNIAQQITQARIRATHFRKFRKYWAITTRVPNEIKGSYRLALKLETSIHGKKKVGSLSVYKYFTQEYPSKQHVYVSACFCNKMVKK